MTFSPLFRRGAPLGLVAALGLVAMTGSTPVSATRIVPRQHPPIKIHERRSDGSTSSYNWSGYAVTGAANAVKDVKGSWQVPAVKCTTGGKRNQQTQAASFWVGIDGFNSGTVEQLGTDSDCVNGREQYYAWYEFYPKGSVLISNARVRAGDIVFAEVINKGGGAFTVTMSNTTGGDVWSASFNGNVSNAQASSAEWIAEAPSSGGILPLPNFGVVGFGPYFTALGGPTPPDAKWGSVTSLVGGTPDSPLGSFGTAIQVITMVGQHPPHSPKATPSGLASDGLSFSVKWNSTGP